MFTGPVRRKGTRGAGRVDSRHTVEAVQRRVEHPERVVDTLERGSNPREAQKALKEKLKLRSTLALDLGPSTLDLHPSFAFTLANLHLHHGPWTRNNLGHCTSSTC